MNHTRNTLLIKEHRHKRLHEEGDKDSGSQNTTHDKRPQVLASCITRFSVSLLTICYCFLQLLEIIFLIHEYFASCFAINQLVYEIFMTLHVYRTCKITNPKCNY